MLPKIPLVHPLIYQLIKIYIKHINTNYKKYADYFRAVSHVLNV